MKQFKFLGQDNVLTVSGITFEKDKLISLHDDEVERLKASGFWQYLSDNLQEIDITTMPTAEPKKEVRTKQVKIDA